MMMFFSLAVLEPNDLVNKLETMSPSVAIIWLMIGCIHVSKTLFTLERIQTGTDPKWIRSNFFRAFTLDRIQISVRLHWELD